MVLEPDTYVRTYYSIRSEIDGSYELGIALGEGWEPFAVVPSIILNENHYEETVIVVYLRRADH